MSFILEALQKAENERLRGAVPHLHQMPIAALPSRLPATIWRKPLIWLAIAIVLCILFTVGYITATSTAPINIPINAPINAPNSAVPAVLPTPLTSSSQTSATQPPPPPVQTARPTKPSANNEAVIPLVIPSVIPSRSDLPVQLQQNIPQLTIGGYIYAEKAEDRSVILNQKLRHEGDLVAPELVLEKMTRSGMVLNFRGQQYLQSY